MIRIVLILIRVFLFIYRVYSSIGTVVRGFEIGVFLEVGRGG